MGRQRASDFVVGRVYDGQIINIYKDNLVIELSEGVIGRIIGGANTVRGAAVNDYIHVTVVSNDGNGILLKSSEPVKEAVSPAEDFAGDFDGDDRIIPWDNWDEAGIGGQAWLALMALKRHTDAYRKELVDNRQEWTSAKAKSQSVYATVTQSAREQCTKAIQACNEECSLSITQTENRRNTLNYILTACEGLNNNNHIATFDGVKNAVISGLGRIKTAQSEVIKAITKKVKALEALRDCKIAECERERNERLDTARQEQIIRDEQAEKRYKVNNDSIIKKGRADIRRGFNKTTLHAYAQKIKSSRFNVANYECPTAVPEYVMLGEIALPIPNTQQDDIPVIQAVEAQAADYCEKAANEYVVKLPYAQALSRGISLLMRYSPAERVNVQKLIQPLLLKLFMSFPAGKLEATMIDPLEMGASFPDIPRLAEGPNSARIIDTKIWSKERDIENALATLRQRLENMTQAYGTDQESRLKKEVVRALAITDFPVGFNETALKDLHAIVRNSASLGVCVFICANDEELNKLKQRNAGLVQEIVSGVLETRAVGDRLVLTPESNGIFIKLDDMQDVMQNKDKILTQIAGVIDRAPMKIENFEDMFREDIFDSNNWFMGNHEEISIPIGIKGASTVVKMVLGRGGGSTEHHALIAGPTGAGKSTMLHTLIMSALVSYSPDEVQMYLLDFKEGVEFSAYTHYRLPSLRVVAINSEREFGLTVLKELCTELETRTKHFTRYGVSDINSYFKLEDVPKVPKLLLIFDEVQELFRSKNDSDSISSECLSCLNKLVMQGRAMGIHILLACQDFRNCSGLEAYFSQMVIRLAIKGSVDGASSILSSDNKGIHSLQQQPAGAAIYNGGGGVESANNFFQVSYINEEKRVELLKRLDAYFRDPVVADAYADQQTRVLLTNAEDNIGNCFNKLILNGSSSIEALGKTKDGYGLMLGQGFGKKSIFMTELCPRDRDNLLIVTKDERMAFSLFTLSAMSVLYEELHTTADKSNALVYIVDLFAGELNGDECDFDTFEESFPQQVKTVKKFETESLISDIYELMLSRAEGKTPCTERVFLMFFGINRAKMLRQSKIYGEENEDTLTGAEKLQSILTKGARYGINCIVWGENLRGVEHILGERYESMFDKRIASGLDETSMDILVSETETGSLKGQTAVYMDVARDIKNTHFRPYDIPAKVWVERYAEVYDEIINE